MRLLAACLVCFWAAHAQPSPATVDVQVVDHLTGQPVRKAQVKLLESGKRRIATSDSSGRVSFGDVAPGSYQLIAERLSYLWMMYGARRPQREGAKFSLRPGERFSATLRLTPASAISGRVVDEDGDPLDSPLVQIFRPYYAEGWLGLEGIAKTNTDDRGRYRIAGLPPGKYFLRVVPKPLPQQSEMRYVPTYFPASLTPGGATPIQLPAGTEMENISLKLTKVQTVSVRITVTAPGVSKPDFTVYLKPADIRMGDAQDIDLVLQPDGRRVLSGLTPGAYDLSVRHILDGKLVSRVSRKIEVGPADITEVSVTIAPPATVSGTVAFDSEVPGTLSGVLIGLDQGDRYSYIESKSYGNLSASRTFQIGGMSSGRYRIATQELPRGMYIKSAKLGGRELPDLTFELAGSSQIDLTIGTRGGEVSGEVRLDSSGPPLARAQVVLLGNNRQPRWTRADDSGKFVFDSLAPGEYQVFAWEELEGDEYLDPDYMSKVKGTRLLVEEGGRLTANLTAIPVQ